MVQTADANVKRISNLDGAFPGRKESFLAEGRTLIGEGILSKLCRKKQKPRQFFLFNDILVYAKIVFQLTKSSKRFLAPHLLELKDVTVRAIDDTAEHRNSWLITSTSKSFIVSAATPGEKIEWIAHINHCIDELEVQGIGTRRNDSKSHAALWTHDKLASTCEVCSKNKFTPIKRRHHCRKCGRVCCGPCSKERFLLRNISMKPVRVCTPCHVTLLQEIQIPPYEPPTTVPSELATEESDSADEEKNIIDVSSSDGEDVEVEDVKCIDSFTAEKQFMDSFTAGTRSSVFWDASTSLYNCQDDDDYEEN